MSQTLDVQIDCSSEIIHAGDSFLLYLTVRNTFAEAITQLSVSYGLPSGFIINRKPDKEEANVHKHQIIKGIDRLLSQSFGMREGGGPIFDTRRSMGWEVNILPEETYTITMPIRAGKMPFARLYPDTYKIFFDIQFSLGNERHSHQVRKSLIVYPSSNGVYLGAILGGAAGSYLKSPSNLAVNVPLIIASSVSGFVLAIVFRRKANVQQFIAIEDFWGGFLIGVVAGYGGQELLEKFLSVSFPSQP